MLKRGLISFAILLLLLACENNTETIFKSDESTNVDISEVDSIVHITLLYTNDEHGWMEPDDNYSGAPGLMYKWNIAEKFNTENYIVLSGGDMWSGPSISTWFKGESMVQVMSAMNYDAAALGNHEFDYGVEVIRDRLAEQSFPLLAANIIEKESGDIPDFVQPYIVKEVQGVKVGIIGLASRSTPYTTFPTNVVDYEFTDYATAVKKYAPMAKEEGATVLILIGHINYNEILNIIDVAKQNNICVIGGGHAHQTFAEKNNDIVIMQTGAYMSNYAKIEFDYCVDDSTTSDFTYKLTANNGKGFDKDVQEIVKYWQGKVDEELSEQIGYTDVDIYRSSDEMKNMQCDSWLHKFTDADIAFTNRGGIRQDIPQGEITLNSIVSVLPFENEIIQLQLTGKQVKEMALASDICMGGMTANGGFYLSDGTPIEDAKSYTVLTIDYLYVRDDYNFSKYDSDPIYTSTHYRDPLIDWLKSINTSESNPLSNYFDYTARR
nr:bifunctional UDP-sugar hydrolase/5'-nucleotidase [uncultured Carboxylicivirga sp.]